MNRKAKTVAAVAIVAIAAAFGLGQENNCDSSINQLPIAPSVAIATLDVGKVFTKSQKFNAAMAPIRAKLKIYNWPIPENHELAIAQIRVLGETYQRLDEIVIRICKARNIGLVIRAKLDSFDATDRSSMLEIVNRPVVYSAVPDLTDEVIAELNR